MNIVKVFNPQNDSLVAKLTALYHTFKGISYKQPVEFDLSDLNFISPLVALPLSAYINFTGSKIGTGADKHASYLSAIRFPEGIDSVSCFERQVQADKTFVPISVLKKEKGIEREGLETQFATMINKIIGSVAGAQSAIYHPITELVTNIFEHSKQDKGFIFGQYFKNRQFLDICIVDCGRGLASAYKQEMNLELTDQEAIIEVMQGNSTKPGRDRGYGVRSSKRVVCEGLGGEFILLSGGATLFSAQKRERIVSLPQFYWQGVIVAYRIPKPSGPIDIYPFLE